MNNKHTITILASTAAALAHGAWTAPAAAQMVPAVRIAPAHVSASNYGFDITPRRLITGLLTERGLCRADRDALVALFPDVYEAALRPATPRNPS